MSIIIFSPFLIPHEIKHDDKVTHWDDYPKCEIPSDAQIIIGGIALMKKNYKHMKSSLPGQTGITQSDTQSYDYAFEDSI